MGRPRGIQLGVTRVELNDGDFLNVRLELTAGEESDLTIGAIARTPSAIEGDPDEILLDRKALKFLTAAAYIAGWSFVDVGGTPIPWPESLQDRAAALRALSPSDWEEVKTAVDKHIVAQDAKKKIPPGNDASATTSPSVA